MQRGNLIQGPCPGQGHSRHRRRCLTPTQGRHRCRPMAKLVLTLSLLLREPSPAVLTHYGTGDGFLGARHGASWHGDSCGLPSVVDLVSYGVAAPRGIPYCAQVLICHDGACIVATVVDRMADDVVHGLPHFDLWPAAAEALDITKIGIAEGRVWTSSSFERKENGIESYKVPTSNYKSIKTRLHDG